MEMGMRRCEVVHIRGEGHDCPKMIGTYYGSFVDNCQIDKVIKYDMKFLFCTFINDFYIFIYVYSCHQVSICQSAIL